MDCFFVHRFALKMTLQSQLMGLNFSPVSLELLRRSRHLWLTLQKHSALSQQTPSDFSIFFNKTFMFSLSHLIKNSSKNTSIQQ